MADKAKLQGSFGSLLDTLTNRFDPLQPEDVVGDWTGLMVRCAACARATDAWDALADQSPAYDGLVHGLDDATRGLVNADYSDPRSVGAALASASAAVDPVERLIGV